MSTLQELLALLQMDQDRIARSTVPFSQPSMPQPRPTSSAGPSDGKVTGGTPGAGPSTPPASTNIASIDRQIRMMRLQMQAIPFQLRDPIQVAQAQADANDQIQLLEQKKIELGALSAPVPQTGTPIQGSDSGSTPGGPSSSPASGLGAPTGPGFMSDAPAPGSVINSPEPVTPPGFPGPDTPAPPGVGPGTNNQGAPGFAPEPGITVTAVPTSVEPGFSSTHAMGMDPNAPTNPAMISAQEAVGRMADAEAALAGVQGPGMVGPAAPSQAAAPSGVVAGNATPGHSVMSGNMGKGFGEFGGPTFNEDGTPTAVTEGTTLAGEAAAMAGAVSTAAAVANAMADAFSGFSAESAGPAGQADAGVTGGGFSGGDGFGGGDDASGNAAGEGGVAETGPSGPSDVSEGSSSW